MTVVFLVFANLRFVYRDGCVAVMRQHGVRSRAVDLFDFVGAVLSPLTVRCGRARHWAASAGKRDIVEALLEAGADVAAVNEEGLTPLHPAAGARSLFLPLQEC